MTPINWYPHPNGTQANGITDRIYGCLLTPGEIIQLGDVFNDNHPNIWRNCPEQRIGQLIKPNPSEQIVRPAPVHGPDDPVLFPMESTTAR